MKLFFILLLSVLLLVYQTSGVKEDNNEQSPLDKLLSKIRKTIVYTPGGNIIKIMEKCEDTLQSITKEILSMIKNETFNNEEATKLVEFFDKFILEVGGAEVPSVAQLQVAIIYIAALPYLTEDGDPVEETLRFLRNNVMNMIKLDKMDKDTLSRSVIAECLMLAMKRSVIQDHSYEMEIKAALGDLGMALLPKLDTNGIVAIGKGLKLLFSEESLNPIFNEAENAAKVVDKLMLLLKQDFIAGDYDKAQELLNIVASMLGKPKLNDQQKIEGNSSALTIPEAEEIKHNIVVLQNLVGSYCSFHVKEAQSLSIKIERLPLLEHTSPIFLIKFHKEWKEQLYLEQREHPGTTAEEWKDLLQKAGTKKTAKDNEDPSSRESKIRELAKIAFVKAKQYTYEMLEKLIKDHISNYKLKYYLFLLKLYIGYDAVALFVMVRNIGFENGKVLQPDISFIQLQNTLYNIPYSYAIKAYWHYKNAKKETKNK